MRRAEKRLLAFILAFAMVINPFTGIGALTTVKADPALSGLVCAETVYVEGHEDETGEWISDTHVFNENPDKYDTKFGMNVYEKRAISLAQIINTGGLSPLDHSVLDRLIIEEYNGVDGYTVLDPEDNGLMIACKDGETVFEKGAFLLTANRVGTYRVYYNKDYFTVIVDRPSIGVYFDDPGPEIPDPSRSWAKNGKVLYPTDQDEEFFIHLDVNLPDDPAENQIAAIEVEF